MAETSRSRRSFFRSMTLAVAGAAGLWRFLTPRTSRQGSAARESAALEIASADIPANGALVLPLTGIAIVRDGAEIVAVDLACTHLGCKVTANPAGFACPCHGSRFSCRGERVTGPASRPLQTLEASEENGVVRVATNRTTGDESDDIGRG